MKHTTKHRRRPAFDRRWWTGLALSLALVAGAAPAIAGTNAETGPTTTDAATAPENDAASEQAAVIHFPPAARVEGQSLEIKANIRADWKLRRAWVALRPLGSDGEYKTRRLERTGDKKFAAVIPATDARPPGVEYYIASVDQSGRERHHFASPQAPHSVLIHKTDDHRQEDERLARYGGDRSQFELRGQYTAYGRRQADPNGIATDGSVPEEPVTDDFSDSFWTAELEYRYRILTWVHDIRFGLGRMRGTNATVTLDGQALPVRGNIDGDEPGMDYGFGETTLAFGDYFGMGFRLVLGASADGFSAGGGAKVYIGSLSGTHLELGGELQADVGHRGYMSFAWDTIPRVPMALTIELNSRPDLDFSPTGTRLIYDLGYEFSDAMTVNAQVGYASRSSGIEPGFVAGLMTAYEF